MKENAENKRLVLCPKCGAKTRLKLLPGTELIFFRCFARNAGVKASSMPNIVSLKPSSQTLRRSADRKADHALRLFI